MDYRHELKHEINYSDYLQIKHRLSAITKPDPHAQNGKYHIRSLYFDDMKDTALREKLNGINRREKFRIRCYDQDTSFIRLEKKSKLNGLGNKQSAMLSADNVSQIINGDTSWMINDNQPLVRELYTKINCENLRPKTIVDYTREPFIYPAGNVRVTLDYNIRTGYMCTDFLDPDCITLPIKDDAIILEVKWDEFLPTVILDAVQLSSRHTTAFSKYAACRIYG
ncbi:MAG: polyphosphate polymerase domain-containing protein [Oscillospiraceae bacterium]|nr:polyphosphate polymerase domain-containing protein [Oscillospiraceae bacterium]